MNIVLWHKFSKTRVHDRMRTYLHTVLMTSDIRIEHLAATAARFAFSSPRRFPMLCGVSARSKFIKQSTYRTEDATLNANGAWYVVEAETSSTDCVASAVGPSLL